MFVCDVCGRIQTCYQLSISNVCNGFAVYCARFDLRALYTLTHCTKFVVFVTCICSHYSVRLTQSVRFPLHCSAKALSVMCCLVTLTRCVRLVRNSLQRWRRRRNRLGVCLCACQRCFWRCTLHTARTTTWPTWHSRRYSRPLPLTPPHPSLPHPSLSPHRTPAYPTHPFNPTPPSHPTHLYSIWKTLPLLPSCRSAWRRCEGRPLPGTLAP